MRVYLCASACVRVWETTTESENQSICKMAVELIWQLGLKYDWYLHKIL